MLSPINDFFLAIVPQKEILKGNFFIFTGKAKTATENTGFLRLRSTGQIQVETLI